MSSFLVVDYKKHSITQTVGPKAIDRSSETARPFQAKSVDHSHYDSENKTQVSIITKDRAQEIVDFAMDETEHCLADENSRNAQSEPTIYTICCKKTANYPEAYLYSQMLNAGNSSINVDKLSVFFVK